jgi:hypothetical protein
MRMEDQMARDAYDSCYERLKEMFAGDPEIDDFDLRMEAKRYANTFSGGDCVPRYSAPSTPKGD